ncbi:MAG: type I DNA topoisomerase [Candidatus Gastranaerophilales bacterium]|nr:type I DNA topoisomerase [Candidatus Gastranaerophilales bacterium]
MATKESKKTTKVKTTKEPAAPKDNYLVIVESPAKSKTINKMLGSNYKILASYGHIRDFPKKVLGVDVKNNFEPVFEVIPDKKKVVAELSKNAKKASKIYLAPDPDREGEAIAWHIAQVLDVDDSKILRIEFNEITQKAITEAVNHPRDIDMNRVKAQQTRQILDRVVGYKISPVLWKKLSNNRLSAGRVQSVALRLICEREEEIEAFVTQEYWKISADLSKVKSTAQFSAELVKFQGNKIEINNEEEAKKITDALEAKGVEFKVSKTTKKESQRNPQAPFITSTLQREASNRLGYGVAKTMQIAQKLYEGIELGAEGPVGLITYMRTDSTRISDDAQAAAKDFIESRYGKEYYPKTPRVYKKKGKNVQDAHEAVRPSYVERTPQSLKAYLTSEQFKLYKLIWDKFMASQMESARVENKAVEIDALDYTFRMSASKILFNGFLAVYDDREEDEQDSSIPDLEKDDKLVLRKLNPTQHFTQPPPRYSEASLVKVLEEKGIGRPSTYAPIISKIQQKTYIEKIEKSLRPTLLGKTVNTQLINHFGNIVDYNFTANMEQTLDEIAEDKAEWKKVIHDFYTPFIEIVNKADENMEKVKIVSDVKCPNCGKDMLVKTSRWGTQFLGCSGYPECKTMLPMTAQNGEAAAESVQEQVSEEKCAKCGGDMVVKHGPYGQYLQCVDENCKNRQKIVVKTGVKCPKDGCSGEIIQKKSRYGKIFYACNKYPDCDFALWNLPTGEKCPKCGALLVKKFLKSGEKIECSSKTCDYKQTVSREEK